MKINGPIMVRGRNGDVIKCEELIVWIARAKGPREGPRELFLSIHCTTIKKIDVRAGPLTLWHAVLFGSEKEGKRWLG